MSSYPLSDAVHVASGAAALPELGVIAAEGEQAAAFLHGQLTQDFSLMGFSEARLAAFCSAKGRMLASFVAVKRGPDQLLLVCSRDLLAATLKRLQMFVLRAKVKLSDASEAWQVHGMLGDAVPSALPAPPWSHQRDGEVSVVRLYPSEGIARALWIGPAGTAPDAAPLAHESWAYRDVASGVATLTQPVVDAFVPQMLNYESVGGVNFKKGCYPGQEVVARSQFRGTLKRRAFVLRADAPVQAGQEVFHPGDAEQPCGTVVQAAIDPAGGWRAIASLQVAAVDGQPLHAGKAGLSVLPLPYPLLDDI
ncbi:MAG: folate-binding protein YgfZ [Hydrogenophaga sp.]|uniref:CAF17-like 4Fe-4S cluster assembly/insertion protein YgfZ n=1 Tax=Hydrogenophaga sp. TaxID=1904254 RepID=UPI001E1A79DB|nr:folate-binding protein [Hydrogenophaga sp.]MBX3611394.1 folate-binding protein YgfZ [Hydrogenophaga sp.]